MVESGDFPTQQDTIAQASTGPAAMPAAQQAALRRNSETYPIPVSPWNDVEFVGPFPLTPDEWDRMLIILETMRPVLTDTTLKVSEES